ncbi:chemotaxis protein CheB [Ramlibacter monticola]|uniref:protein-glutamate O-methyltransferase n=1 Tax=Ramlibacter monticola TaxID=1926872 RepID=A0A936Z3T6_9BURK|nr:CheR family methyltransferase [Ramlibacter monticola]MBL0393867.1 PAS domain S-box protein [Ramlibacter monticola]
MTTEFTPDEAEEALGSQIDDAVPSHGYHSLPVVGIGTSRSALPQLQVLLQGVPRDSGLAFVVLRHDGPGTGATEEWISQVSHSTTLRVLPLERSLRLQPDTVYLVPPGRGARAIDGKLVLTDGEAQHGRMVIDLFLRSMADTHGAHAAAVVLSGPGADGAVGIKRVKERGGLTVAQDPDESVESAMPRAAISTGMVDWILPASEMPRRLLSYFRLEPQLQLPPEDAAPAAEIARHDGDTALRDILTLLRTRTGRDFAHYKRATILRRIGRRMQVNGVATLTEYLDCLRTRPGEPAALLQDLLITVTNFFRDAGCFAALEQVLPDLFRGKGPGDTLRVWVPACATGEEAYSIAMLLAEHARTLDDPPLIQVFATDLDEEAISAAREGIYPETIEADLGEERLRRFFVKEHRGYRVRRELRETVLFALHDVLKDSPFSRLDLISCRNLLIYLTREAQRRLFDIFHFALVADGKLFLGSSEAVEDGTLLFGVVDKKHRIYCQRSTPRTGLALPAAPSTLVQALQAQPGMKEGPVIAGRAFVQASAIRAGWAVPQADRVTSWGELHLRLLEHLAPPSILINSEYDIVHLSPGAGRYLQFGGGEPTRNLLRAVPATLRIELRAALFQAAQSHSPVELPAIPVEMPGGQAVPVAIRVSPANDIGSGMFLVLLQEHKEQPAPLVLEASAAALNDPVAQHLDREIERLKSHLRDTVEQYEASTEELKASNEELQAMNEELRSATEELETSREELQSINEELTTVNQELKTKVDELGHANSDMHNLMDATAIATVFLDRELLIMRYTPSAVSLFNLIPTDVGRPLTDLTTQLQYPELGADARRVLERLVPVEREVGHADGSWYLARLLPYRTFEDRIAGVVMSFVDITERKQAEEMRLWLSAVISSTTDAIISFSLDQTILSWNSGAERIFGYSPEEAIGRPLSILARPGSSEEDQLLERIAAAQRVENHETVRGRKDGGEAHVALTVSPIRDGSGRVIAGTLTARDVSAARTAAQQLRDTSEKLGHTVEQVRVALGKQQQVAEDIHGRVERLLQTGLTPEQKALAEAIRRDAQPLQESLGRLLQSGD